MAKKDTPQPYPVPKDQRGPQEVIGYFFNDLSLLDEALTHRSYLNEHPHPHRKDNERLEFLGDAVLNLALSDFLWKKYPHYPEGRLSKMRAGLVNEKTLAALARRLRLGAFLRMGKGEMLTGGRDKTSLLADALEALLGAVYLDGGFEAARSLVERLFFSDRLGQVFSAEEDYKTLLQEWCQGTMKSTPIYRLVGEEGPDHQKTFFVELSLGERVLSRGKGNSKKEAEQKAAQKALSLLKREGKP